MGNTIYRLRAHQPDAVAMNSKMRVAFASLLLLLAGCASTAAQRHGFWTDAQGDRGAGVFSRDYEVCEDLVESRRSLIESCMNARGWKMQPGRI